VEIGELKRSDRVWHAYIDNFALRHKNQFATRNLKSLRDSSIHILTASECLYCFRGWKYVGSDGDMTCGMHMLIILHRATKIYSQRAI